VENRGTAGNRLSKGEDSLWLLERGIKNVHQITWPKDAGWLSSKLEQNVWP
jgi:hypothetical protein